MIRTLLRTTIPAAAIILSMTAFADKAEFGTADEAKAMLTKAVAAVKADKAKAVLADSLIRGAAGRLRRHAHAALR